MAVRAWRTRGRNPRRASIASASPLNTSEGFSRVGRAAAASISISRAVLDRATHMMSCGRVFAIWGDAIRSVEALMPKNRVDGWATAGDPR
jgi:hypothetical protein